MNKITVIIPNWNGKKLLEECLKSLKSQTLKDFSIIIVDNGSTDDSVDLIEKNYPEIKIIKLNKNHGFAYACNCGAKYSKTKYIALLNNDAIADKNWLKNLLIEIEKNKDIGSCSSKMIKYFNRNIIDNCGHKFSLTGNVDIGIGKNINKFNNKKEIFGVCGGAAIYLRKAFIKVNGFDTLFHSYIEDFDINYRIRLLGYKSFYVPNAIVYHKGAQTFSMYSKKHSYYCSRNMWFSLIKNCSKKLLKDNFIKIVKNDLKNIDYYIKRGFIISTLTSRAAVLLNIFKLLRKRKKIKRTIDDRSFFEFS